MSVIDLKTRYHDVYSYLKRHDLGLSDVRGTVHYCGIVFLDDGTLVAFLPRSVREKNLLSARALMKTLLRFGREGTLDNSHYTGERDNTSILVTIERLAKDFINNGIHKENECNEHTGPEKPNWNRTIKQCLPISIENAGEVYLDIISTRKIDNTNNFIAEIQKTVLSEIEAEHGWWIDGLTSRRNQLRPNKPLNTPNSSLVKILRNIQNQLYSDRSIRLVRDLITYLNGPQSSTGQARAYGVEDFHSVWEKMLRETITNVSLQWNTRLPKPVYYFNDGQFSLEAQRGMRMDFVIKDDNGYIVADAKYYKASTPSDAPGWPDIVKQMFYEVSMRTIVEDNMPVSSAFIFPGTHNDGRKLSHIRIELDNSPVSDMPVIQCLYLDPLKVMTSYIHGRRDILVR